jgi:hypothetical protein
VRRLAYLLAILALATAGCGDDDGGRAAWEGPPEPAADGTVGVEEFNSYLEDVDEAWEGSAAVIAAEFVRLDERTATRTTIDEQGSAEGAGPATVTLTLDGLLDDSVRAERWTLELSPSGETFEVTSARRDLRCQPGRGHQDFSPEPCT